MTSEEDNDRESGVEVKQVSRFNVTLVGDRTVGKQELQDRIRDAFGGELEVSVNDKDSSGGRVW